MVQMHDVKKMYSVQKETKFYGEFDLSELPWKADELATWKKEQNRKPTNKLKDIYLDCGNLRHSLGNVPKEWKMHM